MIKVTVKQEALRSIINGDTETLELNLGVEMTFTAGETGATTEMRKVVSEAISGLLDTMKMAKGMSRGENEVLVEFLPPNDRKPYRSSNMEFGDDVTGFDWSKGKGATPAEGK